MYIYQSLHVEIQDGLNPYLQTIEGWENNNIMILQHDISLAVSPPSPPLPT